MTTAVDLSQIVPRTGSFVIPWGASEKTLKLRPFDLLDEAWLMETFGERVHTIFKDGTAADFARIAFHQLDPESQSEFVKRKVTLVNEDGDRQETEIGGYKLLQTLIIGPKYKRELILAVWETVGVSRPLLDGIKGEEGDKKKVETGPRPLTSSRASTAGQRNISSPGRRAKSHGGSKKSSVELKP